MTVQISWRFVADLKALVALQNNLKEHNDFDLFNWHFSGD